jgi:hydrogenase maturation factor
LTVDAVRVSEETRKIFSHCGIDPLRVVSEGTLILTAHPDCVPDVLVNLKREGIEAQCIGRMLSQEEGMWQQRGTQRMPLAHPGPDPFWPLMQHLGREYSPGPMPWA